MHIERMAQPPDTFNTHLGKSWARPRSLTEVVVLLKSFSKLLLMSAVCLKEEVSHSPLLLNGAIELIWELM